MAGRQRQGAHLVTSAVEHSAVLHAAETHVTGGGTSTTVPVDITGCVDLVSWRSACEVDGTVLACLQAANHEVGTLQPVDEAWQACVEADVPLLVDAAQVLGRAAPLSSGWSLLAGSSAKWGGPAGVGVLAVRAATRWRSPLPTDDREGGRVPGRPSVPAIAAAAAALEAVAGTSAASRRGLRTSGCTGSSSGSAPGSGPRSPTYRSSATQRDGSPTS